MMAGCPSTFLLFSKALWMLSIPVRRKSETFFWGNITTYLSDATENDGIACVQIFKVLCVHLMKRSKYYWLLQLLVWLRAQHLLLPCWADGHLSSWGRSWDLLTKSLLLSVEKIMNQAKQKSCRCSVCNLLQSLNNISRKGSCSYCCGCTYLFFATDCSTESN